MKSVGLRSITSSMPSLARTNDHWRQNHPRMIESAEAELSRLWNKQPAPSVDAFEIEMARYLGDPFRGTVRRRILRPGETALSLELRAAREAIAAASMTLANIDAIIVTSFLADQIGVGNSARL